MIFDAYAEAGGNFIDAADVYAGRRSEEIVGGLVAERSLCDRMVVAIELSLEPGGLAWIWPSDWRRGHTRMNVLPE